MTEEIWPETRTESGICILCSKCRDDCLMSTQGWICRPCWRAALKNPPDTIKGRLAVLPREDQHGYILEDPGPVFVTVGGTLYFFRCDEHAQDLLDHVRKAEPNNTHTKIVRHSARDVFLYVLRNPDLRMVCVRGLADSKAT